VNGHDEHISPERLAQVVLDRLFRQQYPVCGYWYEVRGDRDRYAEDLRLHLAGRPVVALVVRDALFDNPDAMLTEFVNLISRNRDAFDRQLNSLDTRPDKCGVVLLTRRAPAMPQISSPATMPGWFPQVGGRTISVILEDLTWSGDAPLDCEEATVPEVCARLFTVDGVLLNRLSAVHSRSRASTDALWSRLEGEGPHAFGDFLAAAATFRDGVGNAASFRPDARAGSTFVARIWRTMQHTAPESVGRLAEALANALDLPEPIGHSWYQTMVSVLSRPASPSPSERRAFASNILRTVAVSAQFITVAAHADAYASYPVPLIRSLSFDLRRGLADAQLVLIGLDA